MKNAKDNASKHKHSGHRARMKERFLKSGIRGFASHEILELLMFYSIPRKNTNEIAHDLISTFGSIRSVFAASPDELRKIKGISDNAIIHIKFIAELIQHIISDEIVSARGRSYREEKELIKILSALYYVTNSETLHAILFDDDMHLLECVHLSTGTQRYASISPKALIKTAYDRNATQIVLVHNHINDSEVPSSDDIETTHRLKAMLEVAEITLLEHYLVCGSKIYRIMDGSTADGTRLFNVPSLGADNLTVYLE